MIVYRIQTFPGTPTWTNEYYPTLAEANKEFAKLKLPARLDKIDVPSGREGLCEFLNVADANHMNQPAELIKRKE